MEAPKYAPGHAPSQVQHHAWRTAENSAGYLLPHLTRAVAQRPELKFLDVGCGPGTISASLAKYLAPQGRLVATDIDDGILRRAAEHAGSEGVAEKMEFQKADVYRLPFGDEEFDVVHAHQVLCHLDKPAEAVREMLRVTKGGGIVALRESDMRMWCFWPEIEGLKKFHELMVDVLVANGGQDKGGRKLVGWVLEAGVKRGAVEAGFGTWCYSKPEDRKAWGEYFGRSNSRVWIMLMIYQARR